MADGADASPCTTCGACCSGYRVSFYWAEADDAAGGSVPVALTEIVNPHRRAMRVNNVQEMRCVCLQGAVGEHVNCTIYPQRSSTCREFLFDGEGGVENPRCNEARARHGLPPIAFNASKIA
jgi:uncharacterized protein